MKALRRIYYVSAYYLSWLVFGLVGLLLNLGCAPFLLLPRRPNRARKVRAVIMVLFQCWLKWLHMTKVVRLTWAGFDDHEPAGGTVYVANHPTLVDASFLLARLPNTICIFKPSLMRNPAIGPAAIMAGYVSGVSGVDVIRDAAEHVKRGGSILIFPEGTRTGQGESLGSMKAGFALIAERAQAPVRLISIRTAGELCSREQPWWLPPKLLPARVALAMEREWLPDAARRPEVLNKEVEQEILARLSSSEP